MFGGREHARVDETAGRELGAGFLGGAFKGELGEEGERGVGGYGAVVPVGGGVVDGCEDEVVGLRYVLVVKRRVSVLEGEGVRGEAGMFPR